MPEFFEWEVFNMKKAVYTLTMAVLVFSLAGCGAMGLVEDILPSASPAAGTPAVFASPAVVTPDVEDGIVKDEDGIITDDDTGADPTAKPDTGKKGEGGGKTVSPSPSASPDM